MMSNGFGGGLSAILSPTGPSKTDSEVTPPTAVDKSAFDATLAEEASLAEIEEAANEDTDEESAKAAAILQAAAAAPLPISTVEIDEAEIAEAATATDSKTTTTATTTVTTTSSRESLQQLASTAVDAQNSVGVGTSMPKIAAKPTSDRQSANGPAEKAAATAAAKAKKSEANTPKKSEMQAATEPAPTSPSLPRSPETASSVIAQQQKQAEALIALPRDANITQTKLSADPSRTSAVDPDAPKKTAFEPPLTVPTSPMQAVDPTFGLPVAQLVVAPVGLATATAAKKMTVVSVSTKSLTEATEDGRNSGAVRAAEALGHKRALIGEASGHVVIPELGRVEVRARNELSLGNAGSHQERVDVHVRSDDDRAKHAIVQAAQEIRQHVQVELPNAAVHIDRSGGGQQARPSRDGEQQHSQNNDRNDRSGDHAENAAGESTIRRNANVKGARARFVL